jgi:SAM-dependent methyltransferase
MPGNESPQAPNPWLAIPAADYEAHMGSPQVGQAQALARILADALAEWAPRALAILGCATGNGFEHIDPERTQRIVGVDLNGRYLDILRERHGCRLSGLELVQADIARCAFNPGSFDLIHAALLFEYLQPAEVLPRMAGWLRPGGVLSVVLQRPSATSAMVSETPYTSLRALASIMALVDPGEFSRLACDNGLDRLRSWEMQLPLGKRFHVAYYRAP